jgi:hypothetical protein
VRKIAYVIYPESRRRARKGRTTKSFERGQDDTGGGEERVALHCGRELEFAWNWMVAGADLN